MQKKKYWTSVQQRLKEDPDFRARYVERRKFDQRNAYKRKCGLPVDKFSATQTPVSMAATPMSVAVDAKPKTFVPPIMEKHDTVSPWAGRNTTELLVLGEVKRGSVDIQPKYDEGTPSEDRQFVEIKVFK